MLERQARVLQEREGELWLPAHAGKASVQRRPQGCQVRGTDVGEFPRLDVAPDLFNGVQFGGVGRQAFDGQPGALAGQIGRHDPALMAAEPIPNEHDALAREVPLEGAEKRDEGDVGVRPGPRLKEEARAAAIPAKGQRARNGQTLPVAAGVDQDRRFAARGPRPADHGLLRDAAFVFEDEPGVVASGVFFSCAHRRVFHCSMARSSRSRARRAGRCRDQFSPRRRRHTWPG